MKRTFCLSLILVMFRIAIAPADDNSSPKLTAELEKVKQKLTSQKYLLRYKFVAGETITYTTEHLATVDTTVSGTNLKTKMRTKSVRALDVESVQDGKIRFSHTIKEVDMWSEFPGREPLRYNSKVDKDPPADHQHVAEAIGKPISVITMETSGKIIERENRVAHPNLGYGGLSIPFPNDEIPIGYKWAVPLDIRVRLDDQRVKTVKTRQRYHLEKVEAGVATISVKTQVLSPINDPKVKAQLIQRLSEGEIRFDIDAGRLLTKRLNWDEVVLGFSGPESNMKFLARFTEDIVEAKAKTARQPKKTARK